MISLFEKAAADGIVDRLSKLQPDTPALWGKMTIAQMLSHSKAPLQVALG